MFSNLDTKKMSFYESQIPHIKLCIKLHIQDYIYAYNLDIDKLEKEYLAKLGKGNLKRKKLIEENQKYINDPKTSEYNKQFYKYMNQILELIANPQDNKLALFLLALYFNQIDRIQNAITEAFYCKPLVKIALDDFMETMEYFSYSYFAKDKIINSLIILLYTLLVEGEKCDKHEAIKFIETVVNSNFNKADIPARIRADYIEKYPIYCAGVYNKLPIFQFYTGEKERYYDDEDIEKVKTFLNYVLEKKELIPKSSQSSNINQSLDQSQKLAEDNQLIFKLLNEFYKHYAEHPNSIKQLMIEQAKCKPFISLLKGLAKNPRFFFKLLIQTILTKLHTTITKLTSSQKPS